MLRSFFARSSAFSLYPPRQSCWAVACFSSNLQPQLERREPVVQLKLNMLQDNPGAVKKFRKVGRGTGSSKGRTAGRGFKGQKARGKVNRLFEGGQTPLHKRIPKRGMHNRHSTPMTPMNIGTIVMHIKMGRLDGDQLITARALYDAGAFTKYNDIKHGVKLLADGHEQLELLDRPIAIQLNRASTTAIEHIEAKGGTVECVHYNRLALRVHMKPHRFQVFRPRQARPPPKLQPYYTSYHKRGYLNPQVQMRNYLKGRPHLQAAWDALLQKTATSDDHQNDAATASVEETE